MVVFSTLAFIIPSINITIDITMFFSSILSLGLQSLVYNRGEQSSSADGAGFHRHTVYRENY